MTAIEKFAAYHRLRVENHMYKEIRPNDMAATMLASGVSAGVAVTLTNLIDTSYTKFTNIPLQKRNKISMSRFALGLAQSEGLLRGLFLPALVPSIFAGFVSVSVRIGCYPFLRDYLNPNEKNLATMSCAALSTGALGFAAATPFLYLKANAGLSPTHSVWQQAKSIAQITNAKTILSASKTFMLKGAILNMSQLVTYDLTKSHLVGKNFAGQIIKDQPSLHYIAAFLASISANTTTLLADRCIAIYTQGRLSNEPRFLSFILRSTTYLKTVTVRSAICDWALSYVRFGPLFLISMPLYEQGRRFFGLPYNK